MKNEEQIITNLLNHNITKGDAIEQLKMLNNVQTSNVAQALKEAVSALYLNDKSDYENALYEVVKHLFQIDDVSYEKIRKLNDLFNHED